MHAILTGKLKPVLWSPGSPMWPSRLAQVWKAQYSTTLLDMSDPNAHRAFLRTPLVFLTTKQKAKFLRPLLGGPTPWLALRDLSTGKKKTPWGKFKFSHADPLTSSSGMMTLGLILYDYGLRTGQSGNLERVATSTPFLNYVRQLETSLVYDKAAKDGTTALTKAFINNTSAYDVITAYESAALEAAPNNSNLAVIYPSPTALSEHAVTLLNGGWITKNQREGALAFISYLASPDALKEGLKYHFRPAQTGSDLSLNPELSRYSSQGFQQSYSAVELPSYTALNSAAFQWSQKVANR
jgi:ABC-type glycerol-3-phosphate transport system substrate-binding protein